MPEPAGLRAHMADHMADYMADKDGEARVRIRSSADIMAARQQGRALASQGGFSSSDLSIIASAISEVAQNIVQYANSGEIIITLINDTTKKGVEIVAADQGPGIGDVSRVMRDGYSTGKGLGIGLPGAKRLMDEFVLLVRGRQRYDRENEEMGDMKRRDVLIRSGATFFDQGNNRESSAA